MSDVKASSVCLAWFSNKRAKANSQLNSLSHNSSCSDDEEKLQLLLKPVVLFLSVFKPVLLWWKLICWKYISFLTWQRYKPVISSLQLSCSVVAFLEIAAGVKKLIYVLLVKWFDVLRAWAGGSVYRCSPQCIWFNYIDILPISVLLKHNNLRPQRAAFSAFTLSE